MAFYGNFAHPGGPGSFGFPGGPANARDARNAYYARMNQAAMAESAMNPEIEEPDSGPEMLIDPGPRLRPRPGMCPNPARGSRPSAYESYQNKYMNSGNQNRQGHPYNFFEDFEGPFTDFGDDDDDDDCDYDCDCDEDEFYGCDAPFPGGEYSRPGRPPMPFGPGPGPGAGPHARGPPMPFGPGAGPGPMPRMPNRRRAAHGSFDPQFGPVPEFGSGPRPRAGPGFDFGPGPSPAFGPGPSRAHGRRPGSGPGLQYASFGPGPQPGFGRVLDRAVALAGTFPGQHDHDQRLESKDGLWTWRRKRQRIGFLWTE